MDNKQLALEAIQKKLIGKELNYKEIYAIMDEISNDRLGDVLTTYFVASGYSKGFTNEEIYYLTKAMVETGERLYFDGIVADKHSIGGMPGTRTTLIVVPILAAAGFKIPKSSSRAITTPAGTADVMEVFSNVTFRKQDIYRIVEKTNGCIVWGGSFKIAPADDEIIRIEEPLMFESFDKILVSVMAKKIAFGSTHVVIDIPFGKTVKVHTKADADILKNKFLFLAKKFNITMHVVVEEADQPAGFGIGPLLEAKDALMVLERHPQRSKDLEKRALLLASELLTLCINDLPSVKRQKLLGTYKTPLELAQEILNNNKALLKFNEIVDAQKGKIITSADLVPGSYVHHVKANKKGHLAKLHNKYLSIIAKVLGAPENKKAGIYLHKKLHDEVAVGDMIATLYSGSAYHLKEAIDSLVTFPFYEIG